MNIQRILVTALILSFGLSSSIAQGAVDMFLDFPDSDINGESEDRMHMDEVDVLAWAWGLSADGAANKQGKNVNATDISITKWVDSATPSLIMKSLLGENIGRAVLTVRKSGEKPLEYITITLFNVSVSSYSTGGSGGEDRLTENVTLRYDSILFEYVRQRKDGTGDTPIEWRWDIASNKAAK